MPKFSLNDSLLRGVALVLLSLVLLAPLLHYPFARDHGARVLEAYANAPDGPITPAAA